MNGMKIWSFVVTSPDWGFAVYLFETVLEAERAAHNYVTQWWDNNWGPAPEDLDERLQAYFDFDKSHGEEYTIEEVTIGNWGSLA